MISSLYFVSSTGCANRRVPCISGITTGKELLSARTTAFAIESAKGVNTEHELGAVRAADLVEDECYPSQITPADE